MSITDRRGVTVTATDPAFLSDPNPGIAIKAAALVATTAAITLSGLQTIDGITVAAGDRVLVKNQADTRENGLYNASTGIWQRTADSNDNTAWADGLQVLVNSGAVNGRTNFACTSADPIVLGTTGLNFTSGPLYSADLVAIAALTGTGFAARIANGSWALRTFGAGAGIAVTNGDGVAAAPSIALAAANNNTVLGNVSGVAAAPVPLTQAQLTALVNTATNTLSGAVPAWPNNTLKFFRGDGSYAAVPQEARVFMWPSAAVVSGGVSTWSVIDATGTFLNLSASTTGGLQEAINAAFQQDTVNRPWQTIPRELRVVGLGKPAGEGITGASVYFPPAEDLAVCLSSVGFGSYLNPLTCDSHELIHFRLLGGECGGVRLKPTALLPFDNAISTNSSYYFLQGVDGILHLDLSSPGVGGFNSNFFISNEVNASPGANTATYGVLCDAVPAGANVFQNFTHVQFVHGVAATGTHYKWGTAAPAVGQFMGANTHIVNVNADAVTAGTSNGVSTYGSHDFWLCNVLGVTTGDAFRFETGADYNVLIMPMNSKGAIVDNGTGNIVIGNGAITIGGVAVSTTNAGTANRLAYYAAAGTVLSDTPYLTYGAGGPLLGIGGNGGPAGNITLYGSASGAITLQLAGAAGTYNWNWPTSAGAAGAALLSGGGAGTPMSWTAGALAIAAAKTFTANNALTLAGTDGTTLTFQGTGTVVNRDSTDTLTNKTFDTAGLGNSLKINGTAVSAVTGTGAVVLAVSPALTTPNLGVATATSINKLAITAPATAATLTIADGKTLTVNNSIGLSGTDGTVMTLPAANDTLMGLAAVQTVTGAKTFTALTTFYQAGTATQVNYRSDAGQQAGFFFPLAGTAGPTGGYYFYRDAANSFSLYNYVTLQNTFSVASATDLVSFAGSVNLVGGLQVGTATGGNKGAGTVNVQGGIYLNNTAYTNPDYALEHFFRGKVERFADKPGAERYRGLKPLEELREYLSEGLRLPGIDDEPTDIFARADIALEKIEEATLYVLVLHERVAALESRVH